MSNLRFVLTWAVLSLLALLVACGAPAVNDVEVDATISAGVAATLAAERQLQEQVAAGVAATLAAQQTSQAAAQPDATTPPLPSPTPPRLIAQGAPGDRQGIAGDIVTLDGLQVDAGQQIYGDRFMFQLLGALDPNVGPNEGDGVLTATFFIFDDFGNLVHQQVEEQPFFCVFGGGEPDCTIWVFSEHGNTWPNGTPLTPGFHSAQVEALGVPGVNPDSRANWSYNFSILGNPNAGAATGPSARITDITLPGHNYWVNFETTGFVPQAGSTHVHFFWDTVTPENAGVPGDGPWHLYPAAAGAPNTSPFTEFAAADRPAGATAICILVANADHTLQQGTGNCYPLP